MPSSAPRSRPEQRDALIGTVLAGRYQVLRAIAEGGMARVYEARHTLIDRLVAIKVLKADIAAQPEYVERFLNEARAAGSLGHPHIVASTDMGHTPDGSPFVVFELVHGTLLADEIAKGPMALVRALALGTQMASALRAAHDANIVHRDFKPDNMMIVQRRAVESVKVFDFGISKFSTDDFARGRQLTRQGLLLGTPEYMSPEQVDNPEGVDARTDIYALGCVLFAMLSGHSPFEEQESLYDILHAIKERGVKALASVAPDVPADVCALVMRAVARSADDRYPTMAELEARLSEALVAHGGDRASALPDYAPRSGDDAGSSRRLVSHSSPRVLTSSTSGSLGRGASVGRLSGTESRTASPDRAGTQASRLGASETVPRPAGVVVVFAAVAVLALAGGGALMWARSHASIPAAAAASEGVGAAAPSGAVPAAVSAPAGDAAVARAVGVVHVESNMPGAIVRAGAASGATPFVLDRLPVGEVAVIEVTAPGRQGRRFQVLIAGDHTLNVDLPRGGGIIDASAAESAKAFSAPTQQSTAQVRHDAVAAWANRGKPAGTVAQAAPEVRAEPAVVQSSLPAAPAADPSPPVSTPVANSVQPAQVAPAVTKSTPQVPPGTVDPVAAGAAVRARSQAISGCAEVERLRNPDFGGRITVRASLAPSGIPSSVSVVSSTLGSVRAAECVLGVVRTIQFPPPAGNAAGVTSHTFTF